MKYLKKILLLMLILVFSLSLSACGSGGGQMDGGGGNVSGEDGGNGSADETPAPPDGGDALNVLVAYFSCTNTTKRAAENIHAQINSDLFQIVPAEPYSAADLNYSDSACRANREQNDENARPAIHGSLENLRQYDVVFIGYPIWWGQAPKIIYTFLESYDFSNMTIIPFCTSGGSAMGMSATNLHPLASSAVWKSGSLVRASSMQNDVGALINMI